MAWKNTAEQYGIVAKSFHWALFFLITGLIALGLYMTSLTFSPDVFTLYKWHKTLGVLVLALVIGRVIWRLVSPPPPLPKDTPAFEKWAAHTTHFLIYVAIITIPLSGWLMSSAAPFPNIILGNYQLPALIGQDDATAEFFSAVHFWAGRVLIALLAVHVAAALFHHFVRRDQILMRMLPGPLNKKVSS